MEVFTSTQAFQVQNEKRFNSRAHSTIRSCLTLKQLLRNITEFCHSNCMYSRNKEKAMNTPLPLSTGPYPLLLDQPNVSSAGSYHSIASGSLELGSVYPLFSFVPQQAFLDYCTKTCEIHICTIVVGKQPHRIPHCKV